MSREKQIYNPGDAPKMGRPPLAVPTKRVVGLVMPDTAKLVEQIQKRHGCTVGQAIDILAQAFDKKA